MNSDQAVAMDMPPCGVLAAAMAETRDPHQIDGESPPKDSCGEELAPFALNQMVGAWHLLQTFRAAA